MNRVNPNQAAEDISRILPQIGIPLNTVSYICQILALKSPDGQDRMVADYLVGRQFRGLVDIVELKSSWNYEEHAKDQLYSTENWVLHELRLPAGRLKLAVVKDGNVEYRDIT